MCEKAEERITQKMNWFVTQKKGLSICRKMLQFWDGLMAKVAADVGYLGGCWLSTHLITCVVLYQGSSGAASDI